MYQHLLTHLLKSESMCITCPMYAEQSFKYSLIKHLNTEGGYADLVLNYEMIIKLEMINSCTAVCTIRGYYD